MKRYFVSSALLITCGCGGGGGSDTPAGSGTQVFSESFDDENNGNVQTSVKTLSNWIITPDMDLVGSGKNGETFNDYPGHGLYLDLDGSEAKNGSIESKITFPAGEYNLSFKLGNNPRGEATINVLTVSFGSFSQALPTTGTMDLENKEYSISISSPAKLRFSQGGPADNQGSILDDVRLEQSKN